MKYDAFPNDRDTHEREVASNHSLDIVRETADIAGNLSPNIAFLRFVYWAHANIDPEASPYFARRARLLGSAIGRCDELGIEVGAPGDYSVPEIEQAFQSVNSHASSWEALEIQRQRTDDPLESFLTQVLACCALVRDQTRLLKPPTLFAIDAYADPELGNERLLEISDDAPVPNNQLAAERAAIMCGRESLVMRQIHARSHQLSSPRPEHITILEGSDHCLTYYAAKALFGEQCIIDQQFVDPPSHTPSAELERSLRFSSQPDVTPRLPAILRHILRLDDLA
jgi:hypothetical protein